MKIPGKKKKFRFLGRFRNIPSFSKFRRNIPAKISENSGGIFRNSGLEFRLLVIPRTVLLKKLRTLLFKQ